MKRKEPLKRCPICNCLTLSAEEKSHDICPVCYWEDDRTENEMPTSESAGGPNGISVDEARRNYQSSERAVRSSCLMYENQNRGKNNLRYSAQPAGK